MTQSTPPSEDSHLPSFDPTVPNPARMWNYWLGGKDNFAADREAAERVLEAMPSLPLIARAARLFLIDAVHQLATEHGIRQFLDIGTGLPTADNTHDVAQRAAPESKIVYVDYDPVVLTHAQALLTSSPEGQTDYVQADLRDTDTIVKAAARTLDLTRPVAVLLIAVLHFIPDADDPYAVVARLMDAVPSGSYLVIAHAAADIATTRWRPQRSPRAPATRSPASSPGWTCSHPAWFPSTSGPSPVTSTPPPAPWSATAPSPASPDRPGAAAPRPASRESTTIWRDTP
jgi:O-methyltransferase involved in polyketide biosynthesis